MRIQAVIFLAISISILPAKEMFAQTDFTEVQTFIDSNITRNFIHTSFDNNILSSGLTSRLNYSGSGGRINYFLKNYYSSAVTKLSENLFRDFDNVKGGIGYRFNDELTAYTNYTGMFFSDEKNIQLKGSSSHLFSVSAFYEKNFPSFFLNSIAYAGFKSEEQIGELNRGISTYGELNIDNLLLSDFLIDGQMKLGYEDLDPRKKNQVVTHLYAEKYFSDNLARNEFDGFFSRIRKDFYFPADVNTKSQFGVDNNIEKRTETIVKAFDRFDYTISDNADFYVNITPYYRNIIKENYYIPMISAAAPSIYDTEIQELIVTGDAALKLYIYNFDVLLKASYTERDEKHFLINPERIPIVFVKEKGDLEATKNNHSTRFKLGSNIFYNLSRSNRLELSAISSILKYDTQSEDNFDDRDELNFIVYLSHRYDNLDNFSLINSVDLNMYHTVYVFAAKSSNNNWNRVLRFTTYNVLTPFEFLRTVNSFSVLANYTVYDFEDLISTVRSYSLRQFHFRDSTNFRFAEDFGLSLYGELRLYERGELNWRAFSLRPINYFEDKIINPELNYFFNKFITISGGFRFFEQKRYNFTDGVKTFDTYVRTYGPVARLRMGLNKNSLIEINASYDYYDYNDRSPSASNGNVYVNVIWNF